MERPSTNSNSPQHESNSSTIPHDIPPHPKHAQFRRESRPAFTLDDSSGDFEPTAQANGRARPSIDFSKDGDATNEASPLLPARTSQDAGKVPSLEGVFSPDRESDEEWTASSGTREKSKSGVYLLLLTISFLGLQIAWSVELSHGSPYLLSLGITKSFLAFVWIAGPLSGTLVQPYVGIKSDRCRSRFGKRRPFMVGGAAATIASLLILAWAREIVGGFLSIFGVAKDSGGTKVTTIILAVLMIYVLDFSINVIQAGIRAFVVDNAPTHQQETANAWASRLLGVGNIIGYVFGYANLPKYMWFFGNTQFKVLCVIASLAMAITISISCFFIGERDPRLEGEPSEQEAGSFAFFKQLWRSMNRMPYQIKAVCYVQLAAWIAWFPFLFYMTTYIGEIYVDPIFRDNPNMSDEDIDKAWERGTRMGTFALLVFALVSFTSSVVLPWFITSSYMPPKPPTRTPMMESPTTPRLPREALRHYDNDDHVDEEGFFDVDTTIITSSAGAADFHDGEALKKASRAQWMSDFTQRLPSVEVKWLTLRRAWMISNFMYFLLTWLTFAAHNTTIATILTGLIGIPWSVLQWAPFALIAAEISKRENIRRGHVRPPPTAEGERLARGENASDGADQAGVVLGIHNVAIAAPQVIATLVSSAIFKALQKPRGTPGDDSVAWVLRFGGLLALVAVWLTRRVWEEGDGEGSKPKW